MILGDILAEKLADNVNSYIWRGPKVNGSYEEIKLMS